MADIRSWEIVYLQLRFDLLNVFLSFFHLVISTIGIAVPAHLPLFFGIHSNVLGIVSHNRRKSNMLSTLRGDHNFLHRLYFRFFMDFVFFEVFFCDWYLGCRRLLEVPAFTAHFWRSREIRALWIPDNISAVFRFAQIMHQISKLRFHILKIYRRQSGFVPILLYLGRFYAVANEILVVNVAVDQLYVLQPGSWLFAWARCPFALDLASADFVDDGNMLDRLRPNLLLSSLLKRLILPDILTWYRSWPPRSQLWIQVLLVRRMILTFFLLLLFQMVFHLLIFPYNVILPILKLKPDLVRQFPPQIVNIVHVLYINDPRLFMVQ